MYIELREERRSDYEFLGLDERKVHEVLLHVKTSSGGHFYILRGDFSMPAYFIDDDDLIIYQSLNFPYAPEEFNNNRELRYQYVWIHSDSTKIAKMEKFSQEELAGMLMKSNWLER